MFGARGASCRAAVTLDPSLPHEAIAFIAVVFLQLLRNERHCVTDLNVVRMQMLCLMMTELRALHPHLVDTEDKIDMLE